MMYWISANGSQISVKDVNFLWNKQEEQCLTRQKLHFLLPLTPNMYSNLQIHILFLLQNALDLLRNIHLT